MTTRISQLQFLESTEPDDGNILFGFQELAKSDPGLLDRVMRSNQFVAAM